jgi:hypothetical protein
MTNRVVLWVGGIVAALLVAVIVVVAVLINTIQSEAENQRYRDCMASQGHAADQPVSGVTTEEDLDAYIGDLVDAGEFCSR